MKCCKKNIKPRRRDNMTKVDSNKKFELRARDNGFSIWLNGHWILDASDFLESGTFVVCKKYFKMGTNNALNRAVFTLKKEYRT